MTEVQHSRARVAAQDVSDGGPRFYSVGQVARMLGMSAMTVYRAINAGDFPAVKIRGRLIVPARAVDEMIDAAITTQGVVDAAAWVPERREGQR